MGPYLTGFDTMAHYVPTVLHWQQGNVDLASFIGTAPLFYSLVVVLISGGTSLFIVTKALAVVLMGLLGLSLFWFAQKGLGWGATKSLSVALLGTIYFVALRVSWDMLRTELALILLFAALTLLSCRGGFFVSWKRYVPLSVLMILVILSGQLVAAILLAVLSVVFFFDLFRKRFGVAGKLALVSLPSIILFAATYFFSTAVPEYRLIFGFSQTDGWLSIFGFSSYEALAVSAGGFLLYCFLPLLPFVILGLRRLKNLPLLVWVVFCLVLSFVPLVSPSNLRWTMLLVYPFAFFAVEGVSLLRTIRWRRCQSKMFAGALVFVIASTSIVSGSFVLLPPETPSPISGGITSYLYQIPSSMLQNTVSIADCPNVAHAVDWLGSHVNSSDRVLSHRAFYGWAYAGLNSSQIVLYEYDNPADVAPQVASGVIGSIYLIWWVNGQGWYGQRDVSSDFSVVYVEGDIAVYRYVV